MAVLIACATGNFTDSNTWRLADSTSYQGAFPYTVTIGTSNVDSPAFAPGAITVDGIVLLVFSRSSSPGSNTFTVTLRNSTDSVDVASVTVYVADLPADATYALFVFSSPQTLEAGKNYVVRCVASEYSMVTLHRDGTENNFTRMLRTTTNQAPAAGDKMVICGAWTGPGTYTGYTVTMNENSSTVYGIAPAWSNDHSLIVGQGGVLDWATTSSTKLVVRGILWVGTGGVMNIGTSGSPVGAPYTAELAFSVASNVDSGIRCYGQLNIWGAQKTNTWTLLASDAASGATTVTVEDASGWAVGDLIAIAPTRRERNERESRTITAISDNNVSLSGGLSYPHSGTSPTKAEVLNLTRNVKIHGTSWYSYQAFVHIYASGALTARYAQFYYLGSWDGAARGISCAQGAQIDIQYCGIYDLGGGGCIVLSTASGATLNFKRNAVYNAQSSFEVTGSHNASADIQDNAICGIFGGYGTHLSVAVGNYSGNRCAGNSSDGVRLSGTGQFGTFSGNVSHSNYFSGFSFDGDFQVTLEGCSTWRNYAYSGYAIWASANGSQVVLSNCTAFGSPLTAVEIGGAKLYRNPLIIDGLVASGESGYSASGAIWIKAGAVCEIRLSNCDFSGSGTGMAPHSVADIVTTDGYCLPTIRAHNCKFGASVLWSGAGNIMPESLYRSCSGLFSSKHNAITGKHLRFQRGGQSETDSSVYRSAPPSEKLTPISSTDKFRSGLYLRTVYSNSALNVQVWVRKSSSYTGSAPRLMVAANQDIGISSDTVVATFSGSADTWVQVSGTSPTAASDGVMAFYVDCDGTAGSVYVDDWSASVAS